MILMPLHLSLGLLPPHHLQELHLQVVTLYVRLQPINDLKLGRYNFRTCEIFSHQFLLEYEVHVELNDVLNVDNLHSLLNKPDIQERLLPHLPPLDPESASTNDLENITANIQSSQFKTTLESFSDAFRTGELAPVLAQFNLGMKADEAARRGDLVAFSNALQGTTIDTTSQPSNNSGSNVSQSVTSQESSKDKSDNKKEGKTTGDAKADKKDESFDDNKMDTD
ncbi:putative adhesion regulating molecule 1 (110 kD cell membrane glycoprotein) [Schistosoma mansoni]|uniref:putative adhesion regulating molecule 1 (110 kD cell membrane glycoprotein) n=1 Tax=Schistosoma mansoni TaxID=6183 RepID=UPI00022DCAE5|nr:putative adhesion regulating molecule 1 (110 kD cell membrane glycoprotein) [Schistosoma mansoni]|eukprot:XP_018654567.1 putative adhesion regulating molecule 1 (110 kD cell membrane glycoprotein) [Schistosoma mansoni]